MRKNNIYFLVLSTIPIYVRFRPSHVFLSLIPLLVCIFMPSIDGMWLKRYMLHSVFVNSSIRHWHKLVCAGLMTDLAHTNLCQRRMLIRSISSYDTQLLCLCGSLSHGHDWVFTFSIGLHKFSTTMCTSWEFFDKKQTKMVGLMFWAPLLQSTLCEIFTLSTRRVLAL